jgi:Methylase involved in ubiquinone/menaquinone biosynthesis
MQKKLPHAELTGVDFLPEMLELARRKGVRRVVLADAMKLPFDDASFDCVTIAFGLRNLENCSAALTEMWRVLNAKGSPARARVLIADNADSARAYRFYLHRCLPLLGSF